jgi:hypothetical protein
MAELVPTAITKKSVVIVRFGPGGFPTDGFKPAEYFQVTIDPSYVSKSGDFIRFGITPGDEIVGWQRVGALTVVEVLAEFNDGADALPEILTGHDSVTMNFLEA